MRGTRSKVILRIIAALSTLLVSGSVLAQSADDATPEEIPPAETNAETDTTPSEPKAMKWSIWTLSADRLETNRAVGSVVARSDAWTLRAERAQTRSADLGSVIVFEGNVRLIRNGDPETLVVGAERAEFDGNGKSVRFTSAERSTAPFFTRASRSWILHARTIDVRLEDGHMKLERIGAPDESPQNSRASQR